MNTENNLVVNEEVKETAEVAAEVIGDESKIKELIGSQPKTGLVVAIAGITLVIGGTVIYFVKRAKNKGTEKAKESKLVAWFKKKFKKSEVKEVESIDEALEQIEKDSNEEA